MKEQKYGYKTCGESMNVHGVVICKLGCRPCGEPCELEKMKAAYESFVKLIQEQEEDDGRM